MWHTFHMTNRKTATVFLVAAVFLMAGCALGSEEIVLPTTRCGDFYVAEVSINGQGPWPMILDSGAASTVLSDRILEAIGSIDQIKSFNIGEFKFKGEFSGFYRSMDQLSHALGMRIEGIVGHPVFRNVLLTYDYPGQEVRVGLGRLPVAGPGIVPTGKEKRPYLNARIGRRKFKVLVDTGSGRGLSLSRSKHYRFKEPLRKTGARIKINGLHYVSTGRLEGVVELGPLKLREPIINASVGNGRNDSLVGQEILRDYVLTFDQLNRRMRFDGLLETQVSFGPQYGIGAAFDPKERGWPVVAVFPGSGAEAAGLKVGDVLLARDGEKMWERDCPEDSAYDTEPQDVVLTILRDGEEVDLTVTTRALVP